jgi:hypothetical protein
MDPKTAPDAGPGKPSAGRERSANLMNPDWCGLQWTPWVMFERETILQGAPKLPGVYRIRREGDETPRLTYIGQTGRALRERLLALAAGANAGICPFNDPHTAAPHLWLLRHHEHARLAFSCAPVHDDVQTLCGTEDMLLWRHRVETGSSTEANYGRFYPGYARPTNRWVVRKRAGGDDLRIPGRIAKPLPNGTSLENFKLITPALQGDAGLLQAPWWRRTRLTDGASLPNGAGIYCIYERDADEPVYIGETSGLLARSATYAARSWSLSEPWLAVMPLPDGTPKYVLHELESDLLGWHFWRTGRAPVFQYRKARGADENTA